MADYLNSYVSGALLLCGAGEGVLVGLYKLMRDQTRRAALEKGREEGAREERERLRRAGVHIPPDNDESTVWVVSDGTAFRPVDEPSKIVDRKDRKTFE